MIKKKTIISIILGGLFISPVFAQSVYNTTGEIQSSATIENTCLISADNINFGQVYSPLTSQGTLSQMRVQCSNKAPYTIDLAYGGVYGSGSGNSSTGGYLYVITNISVSGGTNYTNYTVTIYKDSTKKEIITPAQRYNISISGETNFNNYISTLYGCNYKGSGKGDTCIASGAYNYGIMIGGIKGDKLAYKITVPGDITKVWNIGNNSYKTTGTGAEQSIDMNAQIVPGNSSSLYLAQDIYTDTVTAVISY